MYKASLQRLLDRRLDANKYDFGHVLIVGGSEGMVGAPLLAAEASLRVGAGLVTVAAYPDVIDALERRVEEVMTLHLQQDIERATSLIEKFVHDRKVSAVVLGPGQSEQFMALNAEIMQKIHLPMIIDAGALSAFAGRLDILRELAEENKNIILTPHVGEFAKLIGRQIPTEHDELRLLLLQFTKQTHCTLVFKGHHTLVVHPDERIFENKTGNPGMATAGTGDVLSGVVAGLLAQGLDTSDATEAGVYLHGRAGDIVAKIKTQPGMIASDIVEYLPRALNELD